MLGSTRRRRLCTQQTSAPSSFIPGDWDRRRTSFPSSPQRVPRVVSDHSQKRQCLPPPCSHSTPSCSPGHEVSFLSPHWLKPSSGRCKPCFLLGFCGQCAFLHVCSFSRCVMSTQGLSLPPAIQQSPISLYSVAASSAAMLLGALQWLLCYTPASCPGQRMP